MSWINKVKGYLFSKGLKRMDFILVMPAVLLLFFCHLFSMPVGEAVKTTTDISLGYSAKQGADGLYYVLDSGHERLVCFNREGRIKFSIENPSDKKSDMLYIDDFSVTDKGVYLSVTEWNGMLLAREALLFYDKKGHYKKTLTEPEYSDNMTNKHRFYGISEKNGKPQYAECLAYSIRIGDSEIPYRNAFHAVSDAVFVGDTVYILNKNGTIEAFTGSSHTGKVVYSMTEEADKNIVPYRLAADKDQKLYFTDIRIAAVRQVNMP